MNSSNDCTQNTDLLKLVREGTSREQRFPPALNPLYAPVDEHGVSHRIVFAQAYAAYLKFFNLDNAAEGDWQLFFSNDASAFLANAAIQDVDYYRSRIKEFFDFLKNIDINSDEEKSRDYLGYLFSCIGTLAWQVDVLKEGLPQEISFKAALQNLIRSQFAPAFKKLLLYYRDGLVPDPPSPPDPPYFNDVAPAFRIMGAVPGAFREVREQKFSNDWISDDGASEWADYLNNLQDPLKYPATGIYGGGSHLVERINHIAAHNLFTSIFDQFLKAYARIVKDADNALEKTFSEWDRHGPHYALFLSFLHLFEHAREEANTITGRHLDFYYREILGLKEKDAEPGRAHLLVELAKQAPSHLIKKDELFKAGKDDLGKDVFFACERDLTANQAKVAALKTVYVQREDEVEASAPTVKIKGMVYASPVANSDDGLGAELTSPDKSWHPLHNKVYKDGKLSEIKMPEAEIGFAVASHYLWMAGGTRWILAEIGVSGYSGPVLNNLTSKITCRLTTEKKWIEKTPLWFFAISNNTFWLVIEIGGGDPAIIPYSSKTHGYGFDTDLPVLLVKLKHDPADEYAYTMFQDTVITGLKLNVFVSHLKAMAVSNDFGPIDTSKPFQPFGASPSANSALVIGSKEVFQKELAYASLDVTWLASPKPYPDLSSHPVSVNVDFLKAGQWQASNISPVTIGSLSFGLTDNLSYSIVEEPDLTPDEHFNANSRYGFVRLKLSADFGQSAYQTALLNFLAKVSGSANPEQPPVGPSISELFMNYIASQTMALDSASADADAFGRRSARFFHLAPFGQAEQHPYLNADKKVFLFPQFHFQRDNVEKESEAEFYIGIAGLEPPQNLALLFQVVDGSADPLSKKPFSHIQWSYLSNNEWISFDKNDVEDKTDELLNSGIITFAIPRAASDVNTLLPAGMHWIRAAVENDSDAVCRLLAVAAQALEAVFTDRSNDPAFPAKILEAGTIGKLDRPDAAVKTITQPFASFGGRGKESATAFYTRICERLRHKERAISLWDYERLILEAFPPIYKVKCLNHTRYEPDESGKGIYMELAPGHITIVTIPGQEFRNLRDPLRPYTSLGLLTEIETFLRDRLSCFVKPHVKNPEFEEVQVSCKVRLYDGFDETFCVNEMQKAITQFLSPWAFPGGGGPSFGGKIYKSVLINFVEDLPYVDYVIDFQLSHTYVANGSPQSELADEVEGSKAVSILVSARTHIINPIKPAEANAPGKKCPCKA